MTASRRIFILQMFLLSPFLFLAAQNKEIKIGKDIIISKISDDIYLHTSFDIINGRRVAGNGIIITDGSNAIIVDSPWNDSLTEKLVACIEDSLQLTISGFIPTHWHVDCMGGLSYLKSRDIPSYSNRMTMEIAREKGLPLPVITFNDSLEISFGTKDIFCYYPGEAHSLDNIVVWIEQENVLFGGCLIKSLESNNLGNIADGNISAYPETLSRVYKKFPDARIVIPGHGEPGDSSLILHTMDLCREP